METAYPYLLLSWRRSSWMHPVLPDPWGSPVGAAGPEVLLRGRSRGRGGGTAGVR